MEGTIRTQTGYLEFPEKNGYELEVNFLLMVTIKFFTISISDRSKGELPMSGFVGIEYLLWYTVVVKVDYLE